jgi:aryl-alcohol dehydrogenase-like predicted oxidoreductase
VEQRTIGSLAVSIAGVGCNNFGMRIDEAQSATVVNAALDAGVNFFDTADIYGGTKSEEFLGQALGARRDEAIVTTKFGALAPTDGSNPGSPQWIRQACDNSLERLRTDHIDLYLQHTPDPATPIGETLGALQELRDAGKIREIGCSNFTLTLLDDAARTADETGTTHFANAQNNYSLLDRTLEADFIPACERNGVTVVPYFPLANGLLTGKYHRGETPGTETRMAAFGDRFASLLSDECFDILDSLTAYAEDHGHTLHELALSWLASNPAVVSVIAGATKPEQVQANAQATVAWELTHAERAEVAALVPADRSFTTPGG